MAERVNILGVAVDAVTMPEAVAAVEYYMDARAGVTVATANAEMIMRATKDAALRDVLAAAALVVPDGAGTVLRRAPAAHRRVYFFGSAPGVAEKAKAKAEQLYPGIEIVGVRDGFFSADMNDAIISDIRTARPDLLLVALGVPKQEKWIHEHLAALGVPVAIGVGGTLDVMAGVMKRAPRWMQKAKLEWLFRGMLQPKRAGRLLALPKFVLKVHAARK